MKQERWIHPNHIKVKTSKAFDNLVGKPLTDKVIQKYQDSGWYDLDSKMARRERAEKNFKRQKRDNREGNFVISDEGKLVYCPV
jgi:hypothetical protein